MGLVKTGRYQVKEAFYSLQGEGAQTGRPAVFCRFAGCNLWSGREAHRERAVCRFCDTDFVGTDGQGGGRFADAEALVAHIYSLWPDSPRPPYVIFTGGEPLLQLDSALLAACRGSGMIVAVETNGTLPLPGPLDWVCVSPKASAPLILRSGQELKLVYPQPEHRPEDFAALDFEHFFLQPLAGPDEDRHLQACIRYCLAHPEWRLSLQTHKWLGLD